MITDRMYEADDYHLLDLSLSRDEHHTTTTPEFFTEPGTVCKVYEDEQGPIIFVKGTPVLRLDIQYVDNADIERNKAAMLAGFAALEERAKQQGFKELVFQTDSRALAIFCRREFGFSRYDGELRKVL